MIFPIKYDSPSKPSPLLVPKKSSTEGDSGCVPSPLSVSYDVKYDYHKDKITVIKMEYFSPLPSPSSSLIINACDQFSIVEKSDDNKINATENETQSLLQINNGQNRIFENEEYVKTRARSKSRGSMTGTFNKETVETQRNTLTIEKKQTEKRVGWNQEDLQVCEKTEIISNEHVVNQENEGINNSQKIGLTWTSLLIIISISVSKFISLNLYHFAINTLRTCIYNNYHINLY